MRFSRALLPTLKEAPTDAHNVSTALLLRAGYVRRVGAGIYEYLPLGLKVLRRVESIVREEMDRAGALEILMPAILPKVGYTTWRSSPSDGSPKSRRKKATPSSRQIWSP